MADDVESELNEMNIEEKEKEDSEDVVDPWTVASSSAKGVDYDKLISKIVISIHF